MNRYKTKLKESRNKNRLSKRNYEKKLCNNIKNDSKSYYAYVRSKQHTNDKVGPLKNSLGEVLLMMKRQQIYSMITLAVCLRWRIVVLFQMRLLRFDRNIWGEGLSEIEITADMVENKLSKLNINKCPGLDGIHSKLLFELRDIIAEPLSKLDSKPLELGIVPSCWREAGVAPLFKKGKKFVAQNYRPVNLTSIVGKIMESILKDVIVEFSDKYSIIKESQHGFTKGRSCLLLIF